MFALAIQGIFWSFVLCVVVGAGLAVFSGHVVRGVAGLALCSVGLAGMFYFLGSPFVALMEILIYIGGVCVTIAFAVMLTEPEETVKAESVDGVWAGRLGWSLLALLAGAGLCTGLSYLGTRHAWMPPAEGLQEGSVEALGLALLTTYSYAFEAISLVLVVATIGALAVARAGRRSAQ